MPYAAQPDPANGCPKCRGPLWDNRVGKKNPKSPDYKCRDKACDGVIWPPRGAAAVAAPASNAKQAFSTGPHIPEIDGPVVYAETGAPPETEAGSVYPKIQKLFDVYTLCWDHAHELAKKTYGNDEMPDATAAMAATLLIAAKDSGVTR